MSDPVQGRRRDLKDVNDAIYFDIGDYGKAPDGKWWFRAPAGSIGGLSQGHGVEEHEDGTITVTGSILIKGGGASEWHGYLTRGVWHEC